MTVQAQFAATVVDEFVRGGMTDAVVCPGSRSTPLAVALMADGRLRVHVVLDERSGGFFALGLGTASGRPAVVVTTSGTAAAELHAAVVEAHQGRVPLIACTADRPPELHHVGAPQTIEQAGLYGAAVRWSFDAGVPHEAASGTWRSMASRAVAEATGGPAAPGPVHLNLAFRDPLVGEAGAVVPGRPDSAPWHEVAAGQLTTTTWPADWLGGRRGVLVAGAGCGDPATVHELAVALGWPVLADPRSGCRLPAPATVATADALLRDAAFADAHRPEAVVRLGGPWASKVLGQWLASLDGVPQVLVDPYGGWIDPDRTAARVVRSDPTRFCRGVLDAQVPAAPDGWLDSWAAAEVAATAAIEAVLAAHAEPTEPAIARAVLAAVPDGGALFTSSSMPVRDVEWFGGRRAGVVVYANRGANGIDGVTSTALGVAAARGPGAPATVVLIGDLAFLHDVNALLIPPGSAEGVDLVIVVIDNGGGGIFSFLPQRAELPSDRFEALFATPQPVDIGQVAAAYGAKVTSVGAAAGVGPAVTAASAAGGLQVVHIRTDREANVAVHDELNRAVAAGVAGR